MNSRFIPIIASLLVFMAVAAACNVPTEASPAFNSPTKRSPTKTAMDTPPDASSGQNNRPPAAQHRIGIRVVNGVGEFYDRVSGEKFVPRGMNYVRLAQQTKADGSATFGHSFFDPGKYDSSQVAGNLAKMHADGYNVVRVFLSPDTMGTPTGGLSEPYMKNVAGFLEYAKSNGIYAIFTLDWIPGGKYGEILSRDCCSEFALMNANFLPPAGLRANQAFFQDFIKDLYALNAPIEMILSYQLRNEMFYDSDQPPLSLPSGVVTTANGKSYDMSKAGDKERMLEENLVYWIDALRTSILQVDTTALVSVGFFHPQEPHRSRIGDPRLVVSAPAIWQSKADFIDLHAYPGFDLNLQQYVENFGVNGMEIKPIIMGEFGGEVKRFPSIQAAARKFIDWQVESCKYGFDGWIFWTWDLDEQPDFFNALMNGGAINGVLAPIIRPDPCSP